MSTPAAAGRGANVVPIPPPLYYAAAVAAGLMLQRAVPLDIPSRSTTAPVGVAGLVAGLALNVGGVVAVARHHTTIVPHHSVATLVTTGAYRISRNPMYAGLALAAAGGTLLAGTWWPLLLMPAALLAVRRLAIDPEERFDQPLRPDLHRLPDSGQAMALIEAGVDDSGERAVVGR